jgi:hypothetical protein
MRTRVESDLRSDDGCWPAAARAVDRDSASR